MKTVLSSLVVLVAIVFVMYGVVGLLSSETTSGLLVAGWVFVGGGIALARLSWRLYRRRPGLHALGEGRTPEQVRALSREVARRQWQAAAIFLTALAVVYLLLALLLTTHGNAVEAASISAITAGALGLLSWWQARTPA